MTEITDEYMQKMRANLKNYSLVILKKSPTFKMPDVFPIVWEHGRRNYSLRAEGKLLIVCPVPDESEIAGVGIFSTDLEETKKILDGDPAINAGVLLYEIHPTFSLPGDSLK